MNTSTLDLVKDFVGWLIVLAIILTVVRANIKQDPSFSITGAWGNLTLEELLEFLDKEAARQTEFRFGCTISPVWLSHAYGGENGKSLEGFRIDGQLELEKYYPTQDDYGEIFALAWRISRKTGRMVTAHCNQRSFSVKNWKTC